MPVIFPQAGTITVQNDKDVLPVQVYLVWDGGQSTPTAAIPASQELSIDLSTVSGLTAGTIVRPFLNVVGGVSNFPADSPVAYVSGGGTATYDVAGSGATLTFTLQQ